MSQISFSPLFCLLVTGVLIFLTSFISSHKHLLATLMSLEGLMLVIFGVLYLLSTNLSSMFIFVLVFLTFTACEGALGLALLINIARYHGGDKFNSLNFLQC